jgi:hypothetical protein
MQFELGIGEFVGILSIAMGTGWMLLQVSFGQFEKRLDAKFESQNVRIAAIEGIATKIQAIELEAARNAASMNMHFVTREEYRIDQVEIKQSLNQIFALLRDMSTKLDSKVDRGDCDRRMAAQ